MAQRSTWSRMALVPHCSKHPSFLPSFPPSLHLSVPMRNKVCFTPQNTPSHSPLSFSHSFPHSFCCFCSSTLLILSLIPPHSTCEASFGVGPAVVLSLQQPQTCPVTRRGPRTRDSRTQAGYPHWLMYWHPFQDNKKM